MIHGRQASQALLSDEIQAYSIDLRPASKAGLSNSWERQGGFDMST